MTRRDALCALGAPFFISFAHPPFAAPQATLYAQSLQAQLARANPHLEFLIHDLRTHQTLANTFADPSTPIPVGSLLKPFLALAYLAHPHAAVNIACHGHADLCWKSDGHGRLSLPQALAQSCNAFFLALARTLSLDELTLPTLPPRDAAPADLIGLTTRWLVSPTSMLNAFAQLLRSSPPEILAGLRLAATQGTAIRIGTHPGGVLAKTGTAPCIAQPNPCTVSGDGILFAALPATKPTLLMLVRQRGTTGATTAASANRIVAQLGALHAYEAD